MAMWYDLLSILPQFNLVSCHIVQIRGFHWKEGRRVLIFRKAVEELKGNHHVFGGRLFFLSLSLTPFFPLGLILCL